MTPYGPKKRIFVSIGQRQGASTADQGRGESATRTFVPNDSIRKNRLSEGRIYGIVIASRGRTDFHQLRPRRGSSSSACRPGADAAGPSLRCRDAPLLG